MQTIKTDYLNMAFQDQELTKLYYTIGEVSEMFEVSKSLIRFWETEFDVLRPHKNSKGDRRFTKQNIQQFKLIYYLVKERGFTLKGAKKELQENKNALLQKQQTIERLSSIKRFLESMKDKV